MRDQQKNQRQHAPLVTACKLYKKVNAKGVPYLMGRLGGVRILILAKRDNDEGEHTHNLVFGEATTQRESGEGSR